MIMINTKRIFTALLLAIIAVTGYAYDFQVDGIYYCYDVYGNAVVTHGDNLYIISEDSLLIIVIFSKR